MLKQQLPRALIDKFTKRKILFLNVFFFQEIREVLEVAHYKDS